MTNPSTVMCAWCQTILKGSGAEPISHGVCGECRTREFPNMRLALTTDGILYDGGEGTSQHWYPFRPGEFNRLVGWVKLCRAMLPEPFTRLLIETDAETLSNPNG